MVHKFAMTLHGPISGGVRGTLSPRQEYGSACAAVKALDEVLLPRERENTGARLSIVDENGYPCQPAFVREKAAEEKRKADIEAYHRSFLPPV